MRRIETLRARLLLGALLWTLGLLAAATVVVSTLLVGAQPSGGTRVYVFHARPPVLGTHLGALGTLLALLGLAGGLVQVRATLLPLRRLRARLTAVRDGRADRLEGVYPSEVQPLVDDLNGFLEQHERRVARARAQAGDLAHGLKTPLAVLALEAERLADTGDRELAATLARQVSLMREQVEYRLAQARVEASAPGLGLSTPVAVSVDGLVRTLRRIHAGRALAIEVDVPPSHTFRGEGRDLEEMLGNLLDNACKWATSRVEIRSTVDGDQLVVHVDDDGPGLPASVLERVLERGARADEAGRASPGSGLGLAIVRDYATLHGGSIALERSPRNGLRATLRLPRAPLPGPA